MDAQKAKEPQAQLKTKDDIKGKNLFIVYDQSRTQGCGDRKMYNSNQNNQNKGRGKFEFGDFFGSSAKVT